MDVLVDYNNLSRTDLAKGATFVVEKVLTALGHAHLASATRIHVRLYDGWYQGNALTPRAQAVSAQLQADFQRTFTASDGAATVRVVVTAELAFALKIDPGTDIQHTYRLRAAPRGLSCADPVAAGCALSPCALATTHQFFSARKCPAPTCAIEPKHLINRGEQKLVDGMLAADLFYLHRQGEARVVVVSSDDDLWPAIRSVLDLGMHVIHVHPLSGHRVPPYYPRGRAPQYTELDL